MSGRIVDLVIRIHCPQCGATSKVQAQSLDKRLRCKFCEAKLYIDAWGKLCEGEPPTKGGTLTKLSRRIALPALQWVQGHRLLAIALTTAVSFLLLVGVVNYLTMPSGLNMPRGLGPRVIFVCESIFRNDRSRMRAICHPDVRAHSATFLQTLRGHFENFDSTADPWKNIDYEIKFETPQSGIALVKVDLQIPVKAFETGNPRTKPLRMLLFWRHDSEHQWRLDCRRSLELLGQTRES